jgi:hypothetical protein
MKPLLIAVFLCAFASAQTESVTAKPPKLPGKVARDAAGKPDLSGIWQHIGVTLFGETGELRPGEGTAKTTWGPPVGPASYKPELKAKVEHLASDDRLSPTVQCKMAGVPRATGGVTPFEIIQTPKKVAILYESNHAFRIIPLDKPHRADIFASYMGDSVGHWEGDTFVVDVTGFNTLPGCRAPDTSTAKICMSSNGTRSNPTIRCITKPSWKTRKCSPSPGRTASS